MLSKAGSEPEPRAIPPLPLEVLVNVAGNLDTADAVSLSRVSRICHMASESSVWRTLDVTVNQSYGVRPFAYADELDIGQETWMDAEMPLVIRARQDELRRKIKALLMRLDAKRVGWVKRLVIELEPPAHAPLQLLDLLSDSLERLVFCTTSEGRRDLTSFARVYKNEIIDTRLIASGISFSRLTHLEFQPGSIRYYEMVLQLLRMAPKVTSLVLYVSQTLPLPPEDLDPDFLELEHDTSLRYLQVRFDDCEGTPESGHPILDILAKSPRLQQLSLRCGDDALPVMDFAFRIIRQLADLRDLYLGVELEDFVRLQDESSEVLFPSLRRLVLMQWNPVLSGACLQLFSDFPSLPILEQLFIDCDPPDGRGSPVPPRIAESNVLNMPPKLASGLRSCPRLRTVRTISCQWTNSDVDVFTQLDDDHWDDLPTSFMSLQHAEEEVLFARWETRGIEVSDMVRLSRKGSRSGPRVTYEGADGVRREKRFVFTKHPARQTRSDFRGMVVPMSVLEEMKTRGGVQIEWGQRGVEIGDEGWKVLSDWAASQVE